MVSGSGDEGTIRAWDLADGRQVGGDLVFPRRSGWSLLPTTLAVAFGAEVAVLTQP